MSRITIKFFQIFIAINSILIVYPKPLNGYNNNFFTVFNPNVPNCDRHHLPYYYQNYVDHVNNEDVQKYMECLRRYGYFRSTYDAVPVVSIATIKTIPETEEEPTTVSDNFETTVNPLLRFKPSIQFSYYDQIRKNDQNNIKLPLLQETRDENIEATTTTTTTAKSFFLF